MADHSNTIRITIPPELEAEMTPAVKAFVNLLIDRIAELEDKLEKLTPRNSSLPPSAEHPHAKPVRNPRPGKKRKKGGQKGHKRQLRELIPWGQFAGTSSLSND